MQHKLYSIPEAAEFLRLHPKTVLRFIHEKRIPAAKVGRSWMISREALDVFSREGSNGEGEPSGSDDTSSLESRIRVSAVIEIREQNSEEASRISNSLMAMLNCKDESLGHSRFDFCYFPENMTAKYIIYGTPLFVSMVMNVFATLRGRKE